MMSNTDLEMNLASDSAQNSPSDTALDSPSDLSSNLAPDLTPDLSSDLTPDLTLDLTPDLPSDSPQDLASDFTSVLAQHMSDRGIPSFRALSQQSGVSRSAIDRLRRGQVLQMQVNTLLKLANFLKLDLEVLIRSLSPPSSDSAIQPESQPSVMSEETFQRSALHTLEPWLLQWSAAANAARRNPQLAAVKLLPLLHPIDILLTEWGVEILGRVGEELRYDPTLHQSMESGVPLQVGDRVRVRFSGYRYRGNLLHRAKVSRSPSY